MSSRRVEDEYKRLAENNAWAQVYQRIGQRCAVYPYTCDVAKKPENKTLNRYRDVNPFDHSRVHLERCENDYINANHVEVVQANRKYILTQGPLIYTVSHFWAMVWEQNVHVIVMLNKLIEKNEVKCHWYWPHSAETSEELNLPDVHLHICLVWEEDHKFFKVRGFMVYETEKDDQRMVLQFHYTTWPDFEVPASPVEFLQFLQRVRETGVLEADFPTIVHCSAGIGRSGTFCLVDSVLLLIEKHGQGSVDVQQILLEMRKYRMGLIQTSEQLRFSYQAIMEGIKRQDPNYVDEKAVKVASVSTQEAAAEANQVRTEEAAAEAVAVKTVEAPGEAVGVATEEATKEATAQGTEQATEEVNEEEEAPPAPPPRGESLGIPPARPLPAIPASSSRENMGPIFTISSSDEDTPMASGSTIEISSDEEDADSQAVESVISNSSLERATLRRRRIGDMAERIAAMKKRSREADRWNIIKRLKSDETDQEKKKEE